MQGSARLVLYVLLLCVGLLAHAAVRLANPQVPQGGSASFASTGTDTPAGGLEWDVINSSSAIVATVASPGGWTVSYNGVMFAVTAPSNATVGTNYEVRYNPAGQTFAWNLGTPVEGRELSSAKPATASAKFDVIGGSSGSAPAAPTGLTATAGNASVSLSWTGSTGATSYSVLRSTTNGSGYTSIASGLTTTSYTDSTVSNGTTYYYVTTATNSYGTSGNSNQAMATPGAVPSAPTGLNATVSNGKVALSWTGSTGANSYSVLRSTTSGSGYASIASGLTATTYTDSTVTSGTYYYVVTATNTYGTSGYSNQASATVNGSPPLAPIGVQAAPAEAQVTVSWVASNGATSYNVKRSTTGGSGYVTIKNVTGTSYTDAGLTDYTTYYYVVSALNSAGESPNSSQASAEPPGPPAAPSLSAYPANKAVALSWASLGTGVTYTLLRGTTSGYESTTVASGLTGTSYTDTGLNNGVPYYYVLYATNAIGAGPASNEASATPTNSSSLSIKSITESLTHTVLLTFEVKNAAPWTGPTTSWVSNGVTYYQYSSGTFYFASADSLPDPVDLASGTAPHLWTYNSISMSGVQIKNNDETHNITSTSSGGAAKVFLLEYIATTTYDYVNGVYNSSVSGSFIPPVAEQDFNIVKLLPDITSLDSRKTFGQPDLAGEQPGDPNAPLRSVNFYGWNYKGGLFAGNTLGSSDLSGTARIQAVVSNPPTFVNPVWSCLTMAYLGHPASFNSDVSYSLYGYTPTNTDIVDAKLMTWANVWNLANGNLMGSTSTSGVTSGQYMNFQAGNFFPYFIVALSDEATVVSQGGNYWSYFANVPWATASGQMAASDAQPRIWVVDLTGHNP